MAADLLVMGAYGHSRLRERIFGGVTRSMVETPSLPIFLAH
jgi:nucleotide-binding universal stress UspA family protein